MKKALYLFIVLIGLTSIIGHLTGWTALKGLGQAYCSSPLPIVFTEVKGVETFAADFYISYQTKEDLNRDLIHISPALYAQLEGPYNRRNVYGAAISYGPILPEELWRSVLEYGICSGKLSAELGLPHDAREVQVHIKTRTAGKTDEWTLNPICPI